MRNDLRIRHDWNKLLAEMYGHVPGFSPERRVNDAGNGDWHGLARARSPRRPERIAVICKEVKGMGESSRRTEREFGSRGEGGGKKNGDLPARFAGSRARQLLET